MVWKGDTGALSVPFGTTEAPFPSGTEILFTPSSLSRFFFLTCHCRTPPPPAPRTPPQPPNTDCSQHPIDTVGVEGGESRWSYTSATDTYTHTPTHALCVCAVHSPPTPPTPPPPKMKVLKKQKEGLTDCRGGTSFITFDAVLLAVF